MYDYRLFPSNLVLEEGEMEARDFFASDRLRDMRINYDLYDGKIDKSDFKYIYSPYGIEGDAPAEFTNKDIISKRINAIDGIERQRPFSYKVMAVNPEATTRREQEEADKMREYVNAQIMNKIHSVVEEQYRQKMEQMQMRLQQAQAEGASPEELQGMQQELQQAQSQMEQEMAQQVEAMTPDEVKKYMKRDHQDPADILGSQILEYVVQEQDVKEKWNLINKDFCCVGKAIGYVGERCGKTVFERVNPMGFNFLRTSASHYIEDCEWCSYERYLNPSEIEMEFGDELSDKDMDGLLKDYALGEHDYMMEYKRDMYTTLGIRVVHVQWKDSKRIGFLTYMDPNSGEEQQTIVSDGYVLDKDNGDVSIKWEWIVCVYEGYKIGADKYARMREVPGQFNDLENLNNREKCKLSYKGVWVDVSLIDRMKTYQFLYSIIWYRIEMLMAKDKGKAVALNASMIDNKIGIDKFLEFAENTGLMFMSGNTMEGSKAVPMNIGEAVKEVNRSMGSDIQQYQNIAEYIDLKCGECVGINQQIIGQVQQNEAVSNAQMAMQNGVNVLEHHFGMFNHFKEMCLQSLIETAKCVMVKYQPEYIQYVLDDFSVEMLKPDYDLLDQSSYGIFVNNSVRTNQILDSIIQLIQPAMQNQRIEMSDVVKILKSESVQEAEELLLKAEDDRRKYEQDMQEKEAQKEQELEQMKQQTETERMQFEAQAKMEQIRMKGEIDLKIAEMNLQRQALLALGFDTDKDRNNNRVPDVIDQLKLMLDQTKAQQKERELDLKERQQEENEQDASHKRKMDEKKLELEREKIRKMGSSSSPK
ncbi:MAG: hypothetical protein II063_10395 [Prevotella sp.]|nr:hypothetical protein [Prevotella sp.]